MWVHQVLCSISNGFFKSVCIVRCVMYWFPFVPRTLEAQVPSFGLDQLFDIVHGFLRHLL